MTKATILQVEGLEVLFKDRQSSVTALRDVSFSVRRGKTLALVGESGSGKSVTSLALMDLLPTNAVTTAKKMRFWPDKYQAPVDINRLNSEEVRQLRGSQIAMIFQEPMSSLNPLYSIGDQIGEMLLLHENIDSITRKKRVIEMLELVEIPAAKLRYHSWPHELSGGMRQRAMIAQALICNPTLLIADEPTTALDVTIQAQILDLMRRLQTEFGMSILFITHDLGVVAEMADDVAVMYAGQVVERATTEQLFSMPCHPYTRGLLTSIPRYGKTQAGRLIPIPGSVPSLNALPVGCSFAPRCRFATQVCIENQISLRKYKSGNYSRCILEDQVFSND
ncbi:MAG: ABC transporter ATP-binding protein [Rhodobacteraceae bacterium]|nr:ABC transporter ATP-binding protein [Paracoccaceae bacterium]